MRLRRAALPATIRRAFASSAATDAPPVADVVVVGGGAAGLTAAFFAAQGGAAVTVLERMSEPGKKILMSGGTRANVLPLALSMADYTTDSSRAAMERVFASWSLADCREWLSAPRGVDLQLAEEARRRETPAGRFSRARGNRQSARNGCMVERK